MSRSKTDECRRKYLSIKECELEGLNNQTTQSRDFVAQEVIALTRGQKSRGFESALVFPSTNDKQCSRPA